MYEDSLGSLTIDANPARQSVSALGRDFDAMGNSFDRATDKMVKDTSEVVRETRRLSESSREWKRMEESIGGSTAAMEKYNRLSGEADRALASGRINSEQHGIALQRLGARYKDLGEQAAHSTKLAAHELNNLSFQAQDFIVQVGSGQGIFRPFLQQAPQALGAIGGVERAISLLSTPTALATMGVGALAAGFGVVAARSVSIQGELRQFNTLLKATGQQADLTAGQVRGIADGMVRRGASRDDAGAVVSSIINTRKLANESLAKDVGALAVDMGVSLGGTVEAGKRLTDWLTAGVPGLRAMAKETGALSVEQYNAARGALEHGDKARALGIAIGALKDRFDGLHHDSLSPTEKAFHDLETAYRDLVTTAAESPITIRVVTNATDAMTGIAEFIKDPSVEAFLRWQGGNPLFGGGLLVPKPPVNPPSSPASPPAPAAPSWEAGTLAAPAGTPMPGQKPASINGMAPDEAMRISDITHANDKLVEAMRKSGAERQIAVAQVQAEISALESGKSARAAELEGIQAARMARAQMSASYSDEVNNLSLAARGNLSLANAYSVSEAAALRQRAANDALATAAGNAAVNVGELTRQNLLGNAATAASDASKTLADMKRQADWQDKITVATRNGLAARSEVERQAGVAQQTSGLLAAAQVAEEEGAAKLAKTLRDLAAGYDEVSKHNLDTKNIDAVNLSIQQQKQQNELNKTQVDLIGASADRRATGLARQQAEIYLRDHNIDRLSREAREYIDGAESLARQGLELDRVNAGYKELEDFGDRSFDAILNKLVAAGDGTATWSDALRGVGAEFEQLALKMVFVNPAKNFALGTNLPTITDLPFFGGSSVTEGGGGSSDGARGVSGGGAGFNLSGLMPTWWNRPVFGMRESPSASFIGPMQPETGFNPTYGQVASGVGFGLSAANFIRSPSIGSGVGTLGAGLGLASSMGWLAPAFGPIGMGLAIAAPLLESKVGKSNYTPAPMEVKK